MNQREGRTVTAAEQGRIGLVTGANQGLGLAVAAGLARAWGPAGAVYLTGRDRQRVEAAAASLARAGLRVLPEVCDVRDDGAVRDLAQRVAERHGGVDFVDSNAAAGLTPGVPFADQVDDFINTNNLGATRMIRWFGQLLRRGGRLLVTASDFGTLDNLPAHLHPRFSTDAMSLAGLATGPVEPRMYGELVQHGRTLPWKTTEGVRHEHT